MKSEGRLDRYGVIISIFTATAELLQCTYVQSIRIQVTILILLVVMDFFLERVHLALDLAHIP